MKFAITGATGFVGKYLGNYLQERGHEVLGLCRSCSDNLPFPTVQTGALENSQNLAAVLASTDVIVHLAGRAHVLNETEDNPGLAYYQANVRATEKLLQAAEQAQVKRFIFISTVKVHGEESESPYSEASPCEPHDDYGKTKLQAEQLAQQWAQARRDRSAVILRPPLIYGPGVKANFAKLIKLANAPVPLPLGSLKAKRSLLFVGNLSSAIEASALRANCGSFIYLVSDNQDLTVGELVKKISKAMNVSVTLLPVPPALVKTGLLLFNKEKLFRRLGMPLQVKSNKIQEELNWSPPYNVDEGLKASISSEQKIYPIGKRVFDFLVASILFLLFLPLYLLVSIAIKLTSKGPVIFWSQRVGVNNQLYMMPKFRTMRIDTPQKATHLLADPDQYLSLVGGFLRSTSLDELPQLWPVLRGQMSLVGPRPALFNQDDLISLRTKNGVHRLVPGITGWAQVNGRDSISISRKVELDTYYLEHQSPWLDFRILWLTFLRVIKKEDVSH